MRFLIVTNSGSYTVDADDFADAANKVSKDESVLAIIMQDAYMKVYEFFVD